MKTLQDKTIGEIVAGNFKTAEIFHAYGIDFCCKGNRGLNEVCEEKQLAIDDIIAELTETIKIQDNKTVDYSSWPLKLLADTIEKRHHGYVEEKIPVLKQFLQKLCDVHGKQHPELFEINELFSASADELTMHMKKEELVLFPFIRKLEKAKEVGENVTSPQFESVKNPVDMMMEDHEMEGDRFRKINALSNGYEPPENACNTYRTTYAMLKDFEEDLHLHIHLENNILFPRSIQVEKELASQEN